jgi:hypothetical protein
VIQAAHRRYHQSSGKRCMPLPALVELPQLTALSLAWRRLVDLKPVLMLVNNTGLVCCWEQRGRWQQRVVGWPEGVCRDGVPLQREAVGELIADLIFDCDCPGAELVLCLPLRAASWCVVDGYGADGSPGLVPHACSRLTCRLSLPRATSRRRRCRRPWRWWVCRGR